MAAESTVDWLKRPTGTVYSFLLPVTGTTRISSMRVPTASRGLRLSIRALRTTRGTSPSIPTMRTWTSATVTSGYPFVQFQNSRANRVKRQVCLHSSEVQPVHCGAIIVGLGNSQPSSGLLCADRIKPLNLGRSPRHIFNKTVPKLGVQRTILCKVFKHQQLTKSYCASLKQKPLHWL